MPTPTCAPLTRLVAVAEGALDYDGFGRGVPGDPLFPVTVQLPGGNAFGIIGTIERAVRTYLRGCDLTVEIRDELPAAVVLELQSATCYDELLHKAICLVDAG